MIKKELFIIGAGSVGGHIALNIEDYEKEYTVVGFLDDDPAKVGTHQFGFEVLGTVDDALYIEDADIVIGIAFPLIKQKIIEKLSLNPSLRYPTLIHDRAWVSKDVSVGEGCIIYPGTTVNYGSMIKDFVVLNANCSLGHHTMVGKYSSFAPGVCTGGHTIIKDGVDVGIGASTIQNMIIGAGSIIGGQSMIIKNVSSGSTVVGVPGKKIHKTKIVSDSDSNVKLSRAANK